MLIAMANYRLGIANVMLGDMRQASDVLAGCLRTLDTEEGRRKALCVQRFDLFQRIRLPLSWLGAGRTGTIRGSEDGQQGRFKNARTTRPALLDPVVSTFGYSHLLIRRSRWEKAAEILDIGCRAGRIACRRCWRNVAIRPAGPRRCPHGRRSPGRRPWSNEPQAVVSSSATDVSYQAVIRRSRTATREDERAPPGGPCGRGESALERSRNRGGRLEANLVLAEALSALGPGDGPEARMALSQALELAPQQGLGVSRSRRTGRRLA